MTERTYRIGEAARLLELEGYVLRYWETEFPQLAPLRTPKGQRLYTDADLDLLRRIRSLLHEHGMTIEGARRVLEGGSPLVEELSSCAPQEESVSLPVTPVPVPPPATPDEDLLCLLRLVEEELITVRGLLQGR